jgi:hypothetical protein
VKAKKPKFKNRYILAEGYPMPIGLANEPYTDIRMWKENMASEPVPLEWPQELWLKALPKYRLVLEKVKLCAPPPSKAKG